MALQQAHTDSPPLAVALRGAGAAALDHRWTRALLRTLAYPQSPDDFLQALHPGWALERVVARVEAVRRETPETTSLYLRPSRNWRPHHAGQHVLLTVTLHGVQHTRCFSLSAAPRDGALLRLTIKAHPGGRVSGWARDLAKAGDRVEISQARGDFVLPDPAPDRLLFLSGGSGMTPLLSMAQSLAEAGYAGSLRWIHSEDADVALEDEMRSACAAVGGDFDLHRTAGQDAAGLLRAAHIAARVPDFRQRQLFVCGPRGLMDMARDLYAEHDLAGQVHHEDFQPRRAPISTLRAAGDEAPRLMLARSRKSVRAAPGLSLLELAEEAGLHPPHGCRRGICHTCKCKKHSGTVRNEVTGAESDASDEEIRLCIHTPIDDVTLDL
ncbi:MAG: ferredoxin reductase [Myxococcales bacterium]|jgi:ferredoxin-NADP reductase